MSVPATNIKSVKLLACVAIGELSCFLFVVLLSRRFWGSYNQPGQLDIEEVFGLVVLSLVGVLVGSAGYRAGVAAENFVARSLRASPLLKFAVASTVVIFALSYAILYEWFRFVTTT